MYAHIYVVIERRPTEIVRVVQWMDDGNVSSKQFSVLKPFSNYTSCPNDASCLWSMVLHRSSEVVNQLSLNDSTVLVIFGEYLEVACYQWCYTNCRIYNQGHESTKIDQRKTIR